MALDGLLLYKIQDEIKSILPAKINKIYQISKTELFFQLRAEGKKQNLIISCHSIFNRINLTTKEYPTPEEPSNFVMFLRKHLESATIFDIEQTDFDRYITLSIATRNEIKDKVVLKMSIELMGRYANVILYNEEGRIMDLLKRIPPFENNNRILQPGAQFTLPKKQEEKLDPFDNPEVNFDFDLTKQLKGFSPILSKEIKFRILNNQPFNEIMNEIKNSKSLYITESNDEGLYHCIPLTHLDKPYKEYGIMEGLDVYYFHKEEKDRIKQMSGDLFKLVRRELKHLRNKLPRLMQDLDNALDCEKWREFGDYLQPYNYLINKGDTSITLDKYDGTGSILIQLDPKLDGLQNAKKYFQKYNKGKKGQIHLKKQIEICKKEINYFEAIEQQLEIANFNDAKEIKDELANLGYCKMTISKIRKKKKKDYPNITTIKVDEKIVIQFGKNNIQNDFVTFELARRNDTWLHAKDYHGAHVIINTDNPDEKTIRLAANIAAYFSKGRYSSSVPVNYCLVKQLKKVPGAALGFVSLSNYKTIYIDPDFEEIKHYFNK